MIAIIRGLSQPKLNLEKQKHGATWPGDSPGNSRAEMAFPCLNETP